jgi:predicted Zn-dependent protease
MHPSSSARRSDGTRTRPLRAAPVLLLALTLLVVSLLSSCATSPLGRRQLKLYPEAQLAEMGVQSFDQLKAERTVSGNAVADSYVRCVADALIAQLPAEERDGWEVVVFEDPTANAFALPGRKIGVHTGLLNVATNADQLAAVVGHEIGHVLADHSNERLSQQTATQVGMGTVAAMTDTTTDTGRLTMAALGLGAQYGVMLPYSRTHEKEADLMGLDLMAKAGFDPAQSVALWKNMASAGGQQPPELLSTHPSHSSRISALEGRLPSAIKLYDQAKAAGRAPSCKR